MSEGKGKGKGKGKRESLTSASGLSASAPPFNFKTHDHEPSFNYSYGCYVPCDDSFENEPNSYLFQHPSANASMPYNSIFKLESLDSCGDAAVNKENYTGRLSEVDVCSDVAVVKGKEYSLLKKLNTSSVLHSSFGDGPCLAKEDLTFNGQGVTGANVSGCVKAMKPAILNSTSVPFAPTGNLLTSFFSRDGASSHFCKTLRGASKSTPPKIDVQLVINTMHDLSELLRWNCSNDLDSLNEHEHDMIRRIIDNLYVCITNTVQQRASLSESGHPCTSYCPVKLPDRHKVMKIKPVTVAHDWERPESLQANFSKKVLLSSSRSSEGVKIGDDVTRLQIIGKALKEREILEEMHPRPLLNGNFWPDASAALCL